MNLIKLNVTETTFKKYLIYSGYNYSIKQFDDMITSIKRNIILKVKNAITNNNLDDIATYIFDKDISLFILSNPEKIDTISNRYFKQIIENSELDLFLEERQLRFSEEIQKRAYFLTLVNNLKNKDKFIMDKVLRKYNFLESADKRNRVFNCIRNKGILLSEHIKSEIRSELKENIKENILKDSLSISTGLRKEIFTSLFYSSPSFNISSEFSSFVEEKFLLDFDIFSDNIGRINITTNFKRINTYDSTRLILLLSKAYNLESKELIDKIKELKESTLTEFLSLITPVLNKDLKYHLLEKVSSDVNEENIEDIILSFYEEIKDINIYNLEGLTITLSMNEEDEKTFTFKEIIDYLNI